MEENYYDLTQALNFNLQHHCMSTKLLPQLPYT